MCYFAIFYVNIFRLMIAMLDFQPFPLQSSSLFGASTGLASSPVAVGAVGVGNVPRNVNIHIHTGGSR